MGKSFPTKNNITIINNEPADVVETIMESSNEENPAKDPKPTTQDQNKGKRTKFEVSYNNSEKVTNNDYDKRIEHGPKIVFSNNRYTTPMSFEFAPEKKSPYLNIFASHKKLFLSAYASTKIITNDGTIFEFPSEFPEGPEYVKHFPAINKIQLQRKVFVSCKI